MRETELRFPPRRAIQVDNAGGVEIWWSDFFSSEEVERFRPNGSGFTPEEWRIACTVWGVAHQLNHCFSDWCLKHRRGDERQILAFWFGNVGRGVDRERWQDATDIIVKHTALGRIDGNFQRWHEASGLKLPPEALAEIVRELMED